MSNTFLGIDVGGTSVKVAALRDDQVLWRGQSAPYARPDTARLIAAITDAARKGAGDLSSLRADGIGLCVPGLMDKPSRTITLSVNVPGLMGIQLDDLISRALGTNLGAIHIVNDAVATGTDVWISKKLTGRLLTIALGTGVGGGVLDDGVPLMVEGESSGHIGQFDVSLDDHAPVGPDGGKGSLEGYLGVPALKRVYGEDLNAAISKWTGNEPPVRALARAVRLAHAIYRPAHVVLAGGIGIRLAHLIPTLKQQIDTNLTSVARKDWTLSAGTTDHHAACGAARVGVRRQGGT